MRGLSGLSTTGFVVVIYKWLATVLVLALVLAGLTPRLPPSRTWTILAVVFIYDLLLTIFWRRLEPVLRKSPVFPLADVAFCVLVIALSQGWRSPYYLYALGSILTAAYFFEFRGGLLAAFVYAVLYTGALLVNGYTPARVAAMGEMDSYYSHYFTFFAVAGFFAYPSMLLNRLRSATRDLEQYKENLAQANLELESNNRQLVVLNEISTAVQSTLNPSEISRIVVEEARRGLGYKRAAIGLVDKERVTCWIASSNMSAEFPAQELAGRCGNRTPADACISERKAVNVLATEEPGTEDEFLGRLGVKSCAVVPMIASDDVVGVMLAEDGDGGGFGLEGLELLQTLANQTAIAVANARLHEQSQELTAVRERNRIALEMHDTVVQGLSGGLMLLDATIKNMSGKIIYRNNLMQLRTLVSHSLKDIRGCIFNLRNDGVGGLRLVQYLTTYVRQMQDRCPFAIRLNVEGTEQSLSGDLKRALHKICQEALTNVSKHAGASQVDITVCFQDSQVLLSIKDDGAGFDHAETACHTVEKQSLGMAAMTERAQALGGSLEIRSAPGEGSEVRVLVPVG